MSTPFTIVADAYSWHEKAEELRLAMSERHYVTRGTWKRFQWRVTGEDTGIWEWTDGDGSASDVLPEGVNLQAESFWYGLQEALEDLKYYFAERDVNYDGMDGVGLYAYRQGSEDLWKTLCRHLGGVLWESETLYGWPRSAEKDEDGNLVVARGRHEENDYIFSDLINAILLVLNNTMSILNPTGRTHVGNVSSKNGKRWANADQATAWNSAWADTSNGVTSDTGVSNCYARVDAFETSYPPLWQYRINVSGSGGSVTLDETALSPSIVSWDYYGWASSGSVDLLGALIPATTIGKAARWETGKPAGGTTNVYGASNGWGDVPITAPIGAGAEETLTHSVETYVIAHFDFTNGPAA